MFRRLAAVTLVALTAACASPGSARPGSRAPGANTRTSLEQRARQDLAAYERAVAAAGQGPVLTPVGPLTQTVGPWVPFEGDRKRAFVTNLFTADVQPWPAPHRTGEVRWADRRSTVPLISAAAAVERMRGAAAGSCPGCAPLHLTHPRLGTMTIGSSRGSARVPAWIFAITGSAVRVAHPAIATTAMVSVTPDTEPAEGLAIESGTLGADGQTLTVSFTGARGPASKTCGADYTAQAVESAHAVVVIVQTHPARGDAACPAVGTTRTATVTLAAPLADRAVLELPHGTPVVTKTA
jgi:hypothetical protein